MSQGKWCAAWCVQYRQTVANMLAQQANNPEAPAHFIVTTFHPQILHVTDKVYGVSHQHRISRWVVVAVCSHACHIRPLLCTL